MDRVKAKWCIEVFAEGPWILLSVWSTKRPLGDQNKLRLFLNRVYSRVQTQKEIRFLRCPIIEFRVRVIIFRKAAHYLLKTKQLNCFSVPTSTYSGISFWKWCALIKSAIYGTQSLASFHQVHTQLGTSVIWDDIALAMLIHVYRYPNDRSQRRTTLSLVKTFINFATPSTVVKEIAAT